MSDSRKLVPTLIFAKKFAKIHENSRKLGSERVGTVMSEPSEPVLTRENSSRLENRLESLVKSSECRALLRIGWMIQFFTHKQTAYPVSSYMQARQKCTHTPSLSLTHIYTQFVKTLSQLFQRKYAKFVGFGIIPHLVSMKLYSRQASSAIQLLIESLMPQFWLFLMLFFPIHSPLL